MSSIIELPTHAYEDQKPGTSGLRKKVSVFQQLDYTETFVQAILEANNFPTHLVLGGDGRYYSDTAISKIINLCGANRVQKLVIGRSGILSTPAASALIRHLKADGGILLTASHNPGGKDGDFGIKYNMSGGEPAPEQVTNKIYDCSRLLSKYNSLLKKPRIDLDTVQTIQVQDMTVDIVDSVDNYLDLMREVFDFDKIRNLFKGERKFKMLADSMNGVVGPYARRILVQELLAPESSIVNSTPMPDFGGKHPDPNLTYANELVEKLKNDSTIELGAAFDGDGDRNMILGEGAFFVTPGDSLAVIGAHLASIKYFSPHGGGGGDGRKITGFARSFPTAPAIDRVAQKFGLECYETPTGWKFFCNLMDHDRISLCGEESFGTGSCHIREKDGLWACLAWMTIIAQTGKTVKQLVEEHWREFGRDYFCRYDFEDCDLTKCEHMMRELESLLTRKALVGQKYTQSSNRCYEVKETGNFEYKDPVTGAVTSKQGLYIRFTNGARIIVRLSGTGSSGATVRLYVSDYSREDLNSESRDYLKDLLDIAYTVTRLPELIGRDQPTVIT